MKLKKHIPSKIKTKQLKYETNKNFENMYTIYGIIQNSLAVQKKNYYKMAYIGNFKKAVKSVLCFNPYYVDGEKLLKDGVYTINKSAIKFESPLLYVYADINLHNRFSNLRSYSGEDLAAHKRLNNIKY